MKSDDVRYVNATPTAVDFKGVSPPIVVDRVAGIAYVLKTGDVVAALGGGGGGMADPGANGVVIRTALNVTTARTITASTGITVTNGDGVSGNPTVALTVPIVVSSGGTGATSLTSTGLLIGAGTGAVTASTDLTFASNLLAVNGDAQLTRNSTDTTSRVLSIRKSRGTSGSPTAVVNNDTVAQIEARGYTGATSAYRRGGYARWVVDTTYGTIADATGRLPLKFQMYRLSAGTEYEAVNIGHEVRVFSGAGEITNGDGGTMAFTGGAGNGTGAGALVAFVGGDGGLTGGPGGGFNASGGGSYGASTGGGVFFTGGPAYDTGDGGVINFAGGDAFSSGVGGNVTLYGGGGGGGNGKVSLVTSLALGNLPGIEVGDNGSAATVGFFGATPVVQPTVSGSRSGNAALASFLSALASEGLIVDTTTAGSPGAGVTLTTIDVDLGTIPITDGQFNIAGAGLTIGNPVSIFHQAGPGTSYDDPDKVLVSGTVTSAVNIQANWSGGRVAAAGIHRFAYFVGA